LDRNHFFFCGASLFAIIVFFTKRTIQIFFNLCDSVVFHIDILLVLKHCILTNDKDISIFLIYRNRLKIDFDISVLGVHE